MNLKEPLSNLAETLEHLEQHRSPHSRTAPAFTIALSREAGTAGTAVAQEVGNRLGWQVYDNALLEKIAKEMNVRVALLENVDEKRQNWLVESVQAFLAAPAKSEWGPLVSESTYVRHLIETVLALGLRGNCVIVGRGSPFILPEETTLRVRLVAPLKHRIAGLSQRLGITEQEAARQVRTLDRERHDFVKDLFLKDPTDANLYDLTINSARLSVAAQAALIIDALHQLQASWVPTA